MLYDLSPIIRPELPVWPGDTPFSSRLTMALAQGDAVNLSAVSTTPHLGSHVDAPVHTEPRGESFAELPLDPYLGPCRVHKVPPVARLEPRSDHTHHRVEVRVPRRRRHVQPLPDDRIGHRRKDDRAVTLPHLAESDHAVGQGVGRLHGPEGTTR